MKALFKTYALYNSRINRQFYDLAATLPEADIAANHGLYFQSILGTLNHIAVADIIWLKRFAHQFDALLSLDYVRSMRPPGSLDTILQQSLTDLSSLRSELDSCIIEFIDELSTEHLTKNVSYKNVKGVASTKNLGLLLLHFFNHQTHHRGQISAALSKLGLDIGITDLLLEIPNE